MDYKIASKASQAFSLASAFKGMDVKRLAAGLVGGTALLTAGIFTEKILDALDAAKVKRKSPKYYKRMLEAHPRLRDEDPEQVAKYWASLYHFAPSMAADPLAAGAFISQSITRAYEFGGPPPDTYSTLTGIEKNISQTSKTSPARQMMQQMNVGMAGTIGKDIAGSMSPMPPKAKPSKSAKPATTERRRRTGGRYTKQTYM